MSINGVNCHELGCPDAWQDYEVKCKWCDNDFIPEFNGQECCCHSCQVIYNGEFCECEDCNPDYDEEEI